MMQTTPSPPSPPTGATIPIPRHHNPESPAPRTGTVITTPNSIVASSSSSYTNSLPSTYRRSSFPVSPAIQFTTSSSGASTTMIPPGLSFERRGCRDDDDYEKATGSKAPFYPNYSVMRSHSVESTPSSASSSRNNSFVGASGSGQERLGWLANSGRSWSVNSATLAASSQEKKKREAVKGWEDPALAAARRALWSDIEDPSSSSVHSSQDSDHSHERTDCCTSSAGKDEVTLLREKNRKSGIVAQNEEAIEFDEEEEALASETESDQSDWDPTPRSLLRPPCHSTLSPGPSCLRSPSRGSLSPSPRFSSLSLAHDPTNSASSISTPPLAASSSSHSIERGVSPSPSSSLSNSSSCSTSLTTTPSIRFSLDPPKTVPTYSKIDYERKGDLPVEKLSIREWIELQGVREAVGVWSGKIAKWEEGNDDRAGDSSHSPSSTSTPTNSTISSGQNGASNSGSSGRPSLSLAALTGVVTVSKSTPSSPTSATSSPRLGSSFLPSAT